MIKAVIIDDEPLHRKHLKSVLEEYCPEILIIAELSSAKVAMIKLPDLPFELLFLDIELGDMNAFELLSKIPEHNFHIIFITAFDKYAIQAFTVDAVDYLLKPVEGKEVRLAVSKAMARIFSREEHQDLSLDYYLSKSSTICISENEAFNFIPCHDILYCRANGNYTEFVFYNEKGEVTSLLATRNITFFEQRLSLFDFIRIHQSYLVNRQRVRKVFRHNNEALLENGVRLEIARDRRKTVLDALMG